MTLHPDLERLALIGWRLVPAARRSRKGLWERRTDPATGKSVTWVDDATCDLDTLERWQSEFPGCAWVVVAGPSGVWALDVDLAGEDHKHDGVTALRDLCAAHGALPPRPHGRSGGGGHLLVFRHSAPILGGSAKPARGIDAIANRQTFTVAPSRHYRTESPYRWVVAPWELAPPQAPEWLLAMLTPPPPPPAPPRLTRARANDALDRILHNLARAGQGGRNDALNRASFIAGSFVAAGMLDEAETVTALYATARHIGLDDAEIRGTIRSGFTAGRQKPVEARH